MKEYVLNDALHEVLARKYNTAVKLIENPATWLIGILYLMEIRNARKKFHYYDPL